MLTFIEYFRFRGQSKLIPLAAPRLAGPPRAGGAALPRPAGAPRAAPRPLAAGAPRAPERATI